MSRPYIKLKHHHPHPCNCARVRLWYTDKKHRRKYIEVINKLLPDTTSTGYDSETGYKWVEMDEFIYLALEAYYGNSNRFGLDLRAYLRAVCMEI